MGPTDGAYGPAEDALRVGALPPGILVDGDALFVAQVIRDLQRWSRPTTATACSTAW